MDEKLHRFCQHFQQGKIRIGLFVDEKHKQIPLLSLSLPFALNPLSFSLFADIPVSIFFLPSFIQNIQNGCLDVSVCPHVMSFDLILSTCSFFRRGVFPSSISSTM
ncbi:hypothetical protein CEXT_103521 [Caerostris extrusa]|uniref:Uncharacterized protein n=1 Tax=Caerostris extrusa TaxID=172846 RepID=A0AAV4R3X7_CAEEX|nr:hypothetical protein CEXT_103521 [Caerostris extrusa]